MNTEIALINTLILTETTDSQQNITGECSFLNKKEIIQVSITNLLQISSTNTLVWKFATILAKNQNKDRIHKQSGRRII